MMVNLSSLLFRFVGLTGCKGASAKERKRSSSNHY